MQFRKKPVVIEAFQLPYPEDEDLLAFNEWANRVGFTEYASGRDGELVIPTLEGDHVASPGDWIIKGIAGEFYPCKPDIFAKTYESADTPADGVALIAAERRRQVEKEGWTAEHDAQHVGGQLADAAAVYADAAGAIVRGASARELHSPDGSDGDGPIYASIYVGFDAAPAWPFDEQWLRLSDDPIRNLVKAGALIAAEIDRLQRAKAKTEQVTT